MAARRCASSGIPRAEVLSSGARGAGEVLDRAVSSTNARLVPIEVPIPNRGARSRSSAQELFRFDQTPMAFP